ncbi:probable serine/threonine-protein kinase DDB_G0281745 [Trifolium pratense]|uniref:probable serine/threonine-protein kinase DDB_G0281745 n=1 Tax=Trifolium pratense TaxID=57577 RepID=UPI001E696758|nr:probable serine/threonine-protein kinase DDB_G0281745 [Trifolium pratense]
MAMASFFTLNPTLTPLSSSLKPNLPSSSSSNFSCNCRLPPVIVSFSPLRRFSRHVVRMAPEGEKLTRRSPIDFPVEWEKPKPGRRPDIFPQFSPMKTPLPPPMPADDPLQEEEEEEEQREQEGEEEEDPNQQE